MKHPLLKSFFLAGAVFLAWNCSDSGTVSGIGDYPEYADFTVTGNCRWLPGDVDYLIYEDGTVTDAQGNLVGSFIAENGSIIAADGVTLIVENIDINALQVLNPDIVNEAKALKEQGENGDNPGEENPDIDNPDSSDQPAIESSEQGSNQGGQSSANIPTVSSSSTGAVDPSGYPIANYERLTEGGSGVTKGYATRYWDACKHHCSWPEKVNQNANPYRIERTCNINGQEIPAFTKSDDGTWLQGTASSCDNGPAYVCTDMIPVAVNDTLSYAFAAVPASGDICGKCYQIQFTGKGFYDYGNPPKEPVKLLGQKKKMLIVMATNIGYDVSNHQFDIMIPGGGVGAFDALSKQLGVNKSDLGEQYGGLQSACRQKHGDDASAATLKQCVTEKCNSLFTKVPELQKGCLWYADWYEAADNPEILFKEVQCPQYLEDKYPSTINTSPNLNSAPAHQNF